MGLWDIIILIIVGLLASFAVFVLVRSHKEGKTSCGCAAGCAGCPGCAAKEQKKMDPENCCLSENRKAAE